MATSLKRGELPGAPFTSKLRISRTPFLLPGNPLHRDLLKIDRGKGIVILNSDVASQWPRTAVGLEITSLWRNGISFFVIGDFLSVEQDDCPGAVQSDFEFVPFPRFSLRVRQGLGQGIKHSRTMIFAT